MSRVFYFSINVSRLASDWNSSPISYRGNEPTPRPFFKYHTVLLQEKGHKKKKNIEEERGKEEKEKREILKKSTVILASVTSKRFPQTMGGHQVRTPNRGAWPREWRRWW